MTWSNQAGFNAQDWAVIREAVSEAARATSATELADQPLLGTLADAGQTNSVNAIFHAAIVSALRARGAGRPTAGDHDLELFGWPVEVKTSSSENITTNRSYAAQGKGTRLLIAVNFLATHHNGRSKIEPFLIRRGLIGPEHYKATGDRGQIAVLLPAGFERLHEIWAMPLELFPARFIPGLGPKGLANLGGPASVSGAVRALRSSGNPVNARIAAAVKPGLIARSANWLTYGKPAPPLRKLKPTP